MTKTNTPNATQPRVKCDGDHGGPRCADPECWNDSPAQPAMELTDEQAEHLIENSDGRWVDCEFRIDGPDLMKLLRAACRASASSAAVGEKRCHFAGCPHGAECVHATPPSAQQEGGACADQA